MALSLAVGAEAEAEAGAGAGVAVQHSTHLALAHIGSTGRWDNAMAGALRTQQGT